MREIKFRGKTLSGDFWFEPDKWVYGDLLHYVMCEDGVVYNSSIRSSVMYHVNPKTVGQFTSLKDKNGTDIYEGDVFNNGDIVVWHDNGFFLQNKLGKFPLWQSNIEDLEVVGNVHDNTELLK